ncbi:MAG TPA: hypothetical protein VFM53_13645 [Anaeromyxobacteraceae bacterium]|nr:hypothetical protein [Anaeromyxobacteraceae bacterium]
MTTGRPAALMVLALGLVPGTGCSWILVNKPPPDPIPATPPLACTSSVAAPVVDTVLAAAALGTGIAFLVMGSQPTGSCTGFGCIDLSGLNKAGVIAGGVLAATAIPLGFSAGFGYATTAECRELKDVQLACISGVEASCDRMTRTAEEACANASRAACASAGDASRGCVEGRTKACMKAAGWIPK